MTDEIGGMTRPQLDLALDWAALEGWNPGRNDAGIFWQTDPGGFLCRSVDGEPVAVGSAVSYGSTLSFLGLFIVRPDQRGKGYGQAMWSAMEAAAEAGLDAGGAVGLDGVIAVVDFYVKRGFSRSHDHVRMSCRTGAARWAPAGSPDVVPATTVPPDALAGFDAEHFGAERPSFLRPWIEQPGGTALAVPTGDSLAGFAVRRACRIGHKIGPLFARTPGVADVLLAALLAELPAGEHVFLDVPDRNPAAVALARGAGMTEVFRCARMYRGPAPDVPWTQVFGATTLELG